MILWRYLRGHILECENNALLYERIFALKNWTQWFGNFREMLPCLKYEIRILKLETGRLHIKHHRSTWMMRRHRTFGHHFADGCFCKHFGIWARVAKPSYELYLEY